MINTFKSLNPDSEYRLTKIHMKRQSMVYSGDRVNGLLTLPEIPGEPLEVFMVKVTNSRLDGLRYIRTSKVVRVISQSPQSVAFETEGGIYLLEVVSQ